MDERMLNVYIIVFLRQLEYFKGVMILISNRVKSMDLAFDSRIDINLTYPVLDAAARRQIWVNFAAKQSSLMIDEAGFDNLAKLMLNGREIKNAIKMAYLARTQRNNRV